LLGGPVFTLKVLDPAMAVAAILGFFAFSLAVSGVYLLNDVLDVERDRLHPVKRMRPIASGALSLPAAMAFSIALLGLGLAACFLLGPHFGAMALLYVVLTVVYSLLMKNV